MLPGMAAKDKKVSKERKIQLCEGKLQQKKVNFLVRRSR